MSALDTLPVPPPGSCAPRALGRLLGLVAAGCIGPDTLADRLGVEPSVLTARLELAAWLGFLELSSTARGEQVPTLSRRGLELVYSAGRRPRVYAETLWDHPVVGPLMAQQPGQRFEACQLQALLAQRHPGLNSQHLERLAASLVVVMEPALRHKPRRRDRRPGTQLRLAFPRPRAPVTGYRFRVRSQPEVEPGCTDPAIYRAVLQALLDDGELAIGQLGAILAGLGVDGVPAGPYAEMAVRRGDARRQIDGHLDRLVVTPAAIARRDLSDTVGSVALSDPDYREYLAVLQATGKGDLGAAARYGRLRARFRCWDDRVFGTDVTPRALAHAANRLLEGRTLAAIPLAVPEAELGYLPRSAPFLDLIEHRNLVVALPPSIDLLVGGLAAVKRALGTPHAAFTPRLLVHGGLVHPGEPVPSSIPDGVSLRLHAVERVPHLALLVAILLQQRASRGRVSLRVRGERIRVYHRRRELGSFLLRADELMADRGWLVSRRQRGGLLEASLLDACIALGIGVQAGSLLVLHEGFYRRLLGQPEDRHLHDRLAPLGAWAEERLGEWAVGVEPLPANAEPDPGAIEP